MRSWASSCTYVTYSDKRCTKALLGRSRWMFSSAKPLWPCIKVKVIDTSISIIYALRKSTVICQVRIWLKYCRDMAIIVKLKTCQVETPLWPCVQSKVIGLRNNDIDLSSDYVHSKLDGIAWTVYEIIEHSLFSPFTSIWPWKVKINIINTWCILMSEAVTVPSLMRMTLTVSEESLERDRQTDRHTHQLL